MWNRNSRHPKGKSNWTLSRRSSRTKRYGWIALILALVMTGYWLKCQLGINFFPLVSISSCFPFNYLADDSISAKKPGVIVAEDFDHFRLFNQWSDSSIRHNNGITRLLSEKGFDDSRCLLITSVEERRWAYPYAKLITVTRGDIFRFEGLVYLEGGSRVARLCVATFDESRNAMDWAMAMEGVEKFGVWVKVSKQFTIVDDGVRYISFRLTGGRGTYRFDNLKLSKLMQPAEKHY